MAIIPTETPREHLRNALMLITNSERRPVRTHAGQSYEVTLDRDAYVMVVERLDRALAQLDAAAKRYPNLAAMIQQASLYMSPAQEEK